MAEYTQDGSIISLKTPLGKDALLLTVFNGQEAISRLYQFDLRMIVPVGATIDFSRIVGQNVTVSLLGADGKPRYFNGFVSSFAATGGDHLFTHFRAQVVPWLWMLTREADCRIFHNKNVKDVIEAVFQDRGYHDYSFSLSASYSPMEYCVQYRETDFNFVSRLMEQYGIFYWFEHKDGSHTLKIADSQNAFEPCPGQKSARYAPVAGAVEQEDHVSTFAFGQELKTGKCSLTDYNFKTPSTDLSATEATIYTVGPNASFELFDYPGLYTTKSDGTAAATLRMQEEEASHLTCHGESTCRAFAAGYRFELKDYPVKLPDKNLILTEVQHIVSAEGRYFSDSKKREPESYANRFVCIPQSVRYRPARLTPKPYVQGPQTAVVTGKEGEEIWTDDYGRVQLLFPWDRRKDDSCWVRVSQDWAGKNWGMINIPRIGQEVLVSFLDGDPDRPLVTGRVYNADQMPPYALPANGTRSTFMTRSSKGGGSGNYNELRFEDKTGSEQIFLRGENDLDIQINHDAREQIGNDRSLVVTTDQKEKIGGDMHRQIQGSQFDDISGDQHLNVGGALNQKVGGTISIQAGQNLYETSGQNYAHQAGEMIHLKAGMTVVIEASTEISLKVGGNFIDINPSGVTISGTMVLINSGGSSGSGCGSSPVSPTAPKDPDIADDGSKGTKMN
ncbi:MAG: type VI secretion system tip protein TssI/VgrG [Terracidiphilus sp.]|jgi:type VI secretion system secreted protein VgrG